MFPRLKALPQKDKGYAVFAEDKDKRKVPGCEVADGKKASPPKHPPGSTFKKKKILGSVSSESLPPVTPRGTGDDLAKDDQEETL